MKSKYIITFLFFFMSINFLEAKNELDIQNKILKNLRCLVCQGQSIFDSNSDFAQTIKLVVDDKIKNGKSEKEIYKFLASKYGGWILYKPQVNKVNFLLWVIPYLFLIFGALIIIKLLKKSKN